MENPCGICNKWLGFDKARKVYHCFQIIILPVLDPAVLCNIPLLKVAFYQLKQCHIAQGLNQELQKCHSPLSHHLRLTNTACVTCSQFQQLLMFLCLEACCQVTSVNENLIVSVPQ
jgi:hypothetical protein